MIIRDEDLLAWWRAKPYRGGTSSQLAIGYLLACLAGKPPQNRKLISECERGLAALRAEMKGTAA